jgi:glycosyltransferase involved in cell wall biosynthesis
MKVLIDCVPLTVGGGVQVAIALLVNLAAQDKVTWRAVVPRKLMPVLPPELAGDERLIFVSRRSQFDRLWLSARLKLIEAALAPDVVFTVFGPPFFRARARHLVGFAMPHVLYERGPGMPPASLKDWLRRRIRIALFRRADHIVTETETARQRLAATAKIPLERISVVPNSYNPLLSSARATPPPASAPFSILTPSAHYWHKQLELIPAITAALKKLDPSLDTVFRLTLDPASAPWRAIAAQAARLGVVDRVETLGTLKVTDLPAAYNAAHAVLLPTLREVSTAVYPEAFFFQRPLVTSDLDFARELCGEAALFASAQRPEAYAQALLRVAREPGLTERLVASGKSHLTEAYPTPAEKFEAQLALMDRLAGRADRSCGNSPIERLAP